MDGRGRQRPAAEMLTAEAGTAAGHAGGRSGHSSDGNGGSDHGEFNDGVGRGPRGRRRRILRWGIIGDEASGSRPAMDADEASGAKASCCHLAMDADEASGAGASSCHPAMNAVEASGAEAGCGPIHVVELAASAAGALALLPLQWPTRMHSWRRAGVEPMAEDVATGCVAASEL